MNDKNKKVGFIGLGVMGYPMAGHVFKAGYSVKAFNRNKQKAEQWLREYQQPDKTESAVVSDSIAELCGDVDVLLSCVGNDEDLAQIMLGSDGVFENSRPGTLICDHTTSSAKLAKQLAKTAESLSLSFLDAPVSGGQLGAQNGQLSIMVGGRREVYERALPVLQSYGKTVRHIGEAGSGQLAKMVNQICISGILAGLSEALVFGQKAGLDLEKVLEVISQGAAQSWQMDNRAMTMLMGKFDFGFAVDWMRKDLAFVQDEARQMQIQLPLVEQVDTYYKQVQEMGGGRWDTSSLIRRFGKSNNE